MAVLTETTGNNYSRVFETIHPFPDGNGRLRRLLIVFFATRKRYETSFRAQLEDQ